MGRDYEQLMVNKRRENIWKTNRVDVESFATPHWLGGVRSDATLRQQGVLLPN